MIKLENVSYKYSNGNLAIDNVSCSFNKGEITMVIGKNGSGKSTLLSTIAKIYKAKGNIYLDDVNIKDISNKELRQKLGIVFQDPNNQIIFPCVYDDLKFVLDNFDIKDYDKRIKDALKKVSMDKYIKENPYNLSLGQKQRIVLASVLATNPKYLLLDEITSMIDYQGKKDIYKLICDLKKQGICVIFGTNILDELIYADKIIILDKGIKKILTKHELLENIDILNEYGFNIPFNLKVINKIGIDKINIESIDEDKLLEFIHE